MKKLIVEKLARVTKNRRKIESEIGVKISNRGKEVTLEGDSISEYTAEKIIEALDFGFPFSTAMLLKEDHLFEVINIKDHTKRRDLARIRARIIGKEGKTLKTLSEVSECHFELKDNEVGIIGETESIKAAESAIILIIKGSKQSNVYSYLEKHHPEPVIDLGLK